MPRLSRIVEIVVLVLGVLVFWCGTARAQAGKTQSLHVLEIDSEDGADEQAEALTGALRSRVRSASGWVLLDTTQSLSMLTAALRCPQRPDAACLQRIGDQLKTERFIWGLISKAGGHQVSAEVHLWTRGKPDQSFKETYSDNLKDQNDDTLRKIAGRFFDRLTGGPSATVVVHLSAAGAAGAQWTADATVVTDDNQKIAVVQGVATLLLSGGPHTFEVQASGFAPARQNIVANAGASQDVNVELVQTAVAPPPPPQPGSSRKAVMLGTLIGGGALLVAGGVLGIVFESERSKLNSDRQNNYGLPAPVITDPCSTTANAAVVAGCSAHNTAQAVEVPMIVSLGIGAVLGATGIWLLSTDHKEGQEPAGSTALHDVRVLPAFGPHGGSLGISAAF
jgi:hypothetical protein